MNEPLRDTGVDDRLAALHAERDRRDDERALDDLKWLLGDARGRRVYAWLLDESGALAQPAPANDSLTNFNNGKRFIGVMLLGKMLENQPEAFLQMINERTSKAKQEELEDKKVKEGNDGE